MKCLWIHWLCDVYQCEHSKVHDSIGLDIAQSTVELHISVCMIFAVYLQKYVVLQKMLFRKKILCSVKKYVVLQKDVLFCKKYVVLQKDALFCKKYVVLQKDVLFCKKYVVLQKDVVENTSYNVNFIVTLQHITQLKTCIQWHFVLWVRLNI